jgi:hypothetical protein
LRCHKKKRKRCRKYSTLLPVNGTYTCGGGALLSCPNTLTLNMTATADARHSSYRTDNLRHVERSISIVICAKTAVIFCRKSASFCGLRPYTSGFTYPPPPPQEKVRGRRVRGVCGPWDGPITIVARAV